MSLTHGLPARRQPRKKQLEECWKDKKQKNKRSAKYYENLELFKDTDLDSLFDEDKVFSQESNYNLTNY
jgi:hypothetical protein